MKQTSAPTPSGRAIVTRAVLPRSLVRKVNAAARKEGIDLDSFIARAIAREPYRSPAPMLSTDETERLALLSAKLQATPIKTMHAILRNALGFEFRLGTHQHRVIDTSVDMKWA